MDREDYTLKLVIDALDELDKKDVRLSVVARKALRIAKLQNDWENVYWIQIELEGIFDQKAKVRSLSEIAPYFTMEELKKLKERVFWETISSRSMSVIDESGKIDDSRILQYGIQEIEENALVFSREEEPLPGNLHPYDAAVFSAKRRENRASLEVYEVQFRTVIARISQRIHSYLSMVERQIVLGQLKSDVFEDNRLYVDNKLSEFAPKVLDQLTTAYKRTREGTNEARSHALLSCRRALKSLADCFYPPRKEPVVGIDGKERVLKDNMFIARLWQFITNSKAGSTSKNMLIEEVKKLGEQIDRLYNLEGKGVHADVSDFEVNLCVMNMYSITGALLRLHDETSGALLDINELNEE